MKDFVSVDQFHEFLLRHGENLVDMMGDEIDRIEMNLSVSAIGSYFVFPILNKNFNAKQFGSRDFVT